MRFYLSIVFILFICISCKESSRAYYNIPLKINDNLENQYLASLSILSEAIKNNPSDPDNYYKRSLLYERIENYKDALVDISRAERLNPNFGLYLFQKAKIQNQLKDPKALSNALLAENQNFDSPDLYVLISDLYNQAGTFNKSAEYFNKAQAIYPNNSDVFLVKGKYYAKRGDTTTAINSYRKSIQLKSTNFDAYNQLIKIYTKNQLNDSALVLNELAISIFPAKKELIFNKAEILSSVGSGDSAIKVYQRFLKLEPSRYDVLDKIAQIYIRRKDFNSALNIYKKWSNIDSENYVPLKKMGEVYESQDNFDKAKEFTEKALKLAPKNPELVANLQRFEYEIQKASRIFDAENRVFYKPKNVNIEVVKPEPERRVFGGNLGNIEKIQKRTPVKIGKDTTRN